MTSPTCSAGEYLRYSGGEFSCAAVPGYEQPEPKKSDGLCMSAEAFGILALTLFIVFFGALIAIYLGMPKRRHKPVIFHDVCRRSHSLSEPCLFTDAQKKLIPINGTPMAYERAMIDMIGKITPTEAQQAIALYREKWDSAGRQEPR